MHDGALVLEELRARYAALVSLAEANAKQPSADVPAIEAAVMRAVAQRFPGALRELDRIPRAQLQAKLAELKGCSVPALWMQVTYDFTLQLRTELDARMRHGLAKSPTIRGRKPSREALIRTAQRFAISEAEARALALPDARER